MMRSTFVLLLYSIVSTSTALALRVASASSPVQSTNTTISAKISQSVLNANVSASNTNSCFEPSRFLPDIKLHKASHEHCQMAINTWRNDIDPHLDHPSRPTTFARDPSSHPSYRVDLTAPYFVTHKTCKVQIDLQADHWDGLGYGTIVELMNVATAINDQCNGFEYPHYGGGARGGQGLWVTVWGRLPNPHFYSLDRL